MSHKHFHKHAGGFEIAISPKDLRIKGKCRLLEERSTKGFREVPEIKVPNKYGASNRLIQDDQYWCVELNWKVKGPLACLLDCGYWKNKVIFEWMGGGETSYSPISVTQDIGKPGHRYKTKVEVAPYSLKPGVYRVICCMQYYLKKNKPGPIVGFHDLGLIKIYQDKAAQRASTDLVMVSNGEEQF